MRKRSIGKLCSVFLEKKADLAIVNPIESDPLYSILVVELHSTDLRPLASCSPEDRLNFKLKSRLLIEDENPIVSRCGYCNSILVQ